ncbi:hypothetical protein BDV98DRAFT_657041 [Pterulicium gracile]|uniref:Uncharacterized protein n=1 Tax=Pterulicium gracile TaxID=1884261 RepID=A0A5C3QCY2_9AGAR|nr:hypothetical protein BDV98DRAFT_657041 [Pterula gracilis]
MSSRPIQRPPRDLWLMDSIFPADARPIPRNGGPTAGTLQPEAVKDLVRRAWAEEALTEHRRVTDIFTSGEYMVDSVGGHANRFAKDARIIKLTDKYDMVYWGGATVERLCRWNFHISKASPSETRVAGQTRPFDEDIHMPVNLTPILLRRRERRDLLPGTIIVPA